jgi:CRISPR/Cas system-associated protein Cas10 (large subunit of type III CRISPR-Cas system)
LCNTLRTLCYCCFLYYKATGDKFKIINILKGDHPDIFVYAAGDDVLITGEKHLLLKMKDQLTRYYAPDTEHGVYGLG